MYKKSIYIFYKLTLIVFFVMPVLFSCSPSRRLVTGEYLYNRARFSFEEKRIDPALLKKYERLSPNKSILGLRFHLFVYNLANPQKDKGLHNWLKKIGEGPVLYDSLLVKQNINNYSKFLSDIGYNNVNVNDSVIYKSKNKVDIIYKINLGLPILIGSLEYNFEDTSIQRYIYADTANSLIKKGMPFNKQLVQAERLRLENVLKNNGYFKFSKEYIYAYVTNSVEPNAINLALNIKQNVSGTFNPISRVRQHQQYKIDKVTFIPEIQKFEDTLTIDTVLYNKCNVLYFGKKIINPGTLVAVSRLEPEKLYSQNNVDKTYSNLSALGIFRFMNIRLTEAENEGTTGKLDCRIDLSMRKRQAYSTELFVTNSSGDFGVRGNITYNNYNFFRGAEYFQLGISGAIESIKNRYEIDANTLPMKELGIFTRLETPKFLLPFSASEFQRKFSPRTAFQFSYNNQHQPKYIRTIANTSFGYIWRGNSFNRHSFYPFDFSLVKLPQKDSAYFNDHIVGTKMEYSFINHTILAMRYIFEFNTQTRESQRNYFYLRTSIESAGPMVSLVNKYTDWVADSLFFGVQFSQYLRSDIDLRFFNIITPSNKVVYRFYAGIGLPYGNSQSMPFEKMFWSGGPFGIRAWSERSLGPGSSQNPDTLRNQLGDIKLEGNIEYRFKLFWKMEGAFFADAGNIWLIKEGEKDPAEFNIPGFHKDIAIGTGLGLRFDLSFVLIRADLGFKVKDPARNQGEKWMFQNDNYMLKYSTFQFGIGYPF